jgi:lipoate-protein ligase A
MVVRSLRSCGVDRARVNERHDIVLDQGEHIADTDLDDTHVTPYTRTTEDGPRPLKVSGSAYKLTRGRALHHGTCLLSSPNLDKISAFLRSPAKPYIKARGVESVSSPVTNVNLSSDQFIRFVQEQFSRMYHPSYAITATKINDTVLDIPDIAKEYAELQVSTLTSLYFVFFTLQVTLLIVLPRLQSGNTSKPPNSPSQTRKRPLQTLLAPSTSP